MMTATHYGRYRATPTGSPHQPGELPETGYLVLPGFLPRTLVDRLRPEVDSWVDDGLRARSIECCVDPGAVGPPAVMELDLPAHRELVCYPPLMELLGELVGAPFAFHHVHSDRHDATTPGKAWHHDYEQRPQRDRSFAMIHALHYLDGLDRDTASLAILPGSHREVAEKTAHASRQTEELPGEVVIDELPPGSTVVLHSALFHCRRPGPDGAGPTRFRYLTDASYCQVGTRWPPVKPYWRQMLARARDLRMAGDHWPELFQERHFTEYQRPA